MSMKTYETYKRERKLQCVSGFIHRWPSSCSSRHQYVSSNKTNTTSQRHIIDRLISWNRCEYSQMSFQAGGTGHQDAATEMHHTAGTISPGCMTSLKVNWFVSHNSIFMRLLLARLSRMVGLSGFTKCLCSIRKIFLIAGLKPWNQISEFCGFVFTSHLYASVLLKVNTISKYAHLNCTHHGLFSITNA